MSPPLPQRRPATAGVIVLEARPEATRTDDRALVERARAGEPWAFEAIYRRHVGAVAGAARRLLRDVAETEDVVQETFLIAFEQLGRLDAGEALHVWLVRIAVSRVHRRFRRRRFVAWLTGERLVTTLEQQASEDLDPSQRAELALLDRALSHVAPARRTPWLLRHVLGYGLDDVAAMCACSLATAKRRIAEIEALVRAHTKEQREEEQR